MKLRSKILVILVLLFAVIQFIRPAKNISAEPSGNEISQQFHIPPGVRSILQTSCYDCHSNNTRYPWYSWVQPVGWWLGNHIKHAKEELNFDEFSTYPPKRQYRKFDEMDEMVSEKKMPLSSYLLVHRDAALSQDEIARFVDWTKEMRRELKTKFPAESLMDDDSED